MSTIISSMTPSQATSIIITLCIAYLVGSIPWAYVIVKAVTGEDITAHGSGNVGAMNVRRTTGSWGWFALTMLADGLKGFLPVVLAFFACAPESGMSDVLASMSPAALDTASVSRLAMQAAVLGAVLGHNYSVFMALLRGRLTRSGKGLATGGGALLAYDWRYFIAVVIVGLTVIALTRYMMAGQVAAAATLPITALVLGAPDLGFAVVMGLLVYAAHHRRFVGLLRGTEPQLYINDGMGPKG